MAAVTPDALTAYAEAAANGDDRALAVLVRETQPMVWRLCSALGSPGEEEDLVQETYLRIVRSLPSFRAESPVLPWMLSIGRRVCADHVRRRGRQRRLAERVRLNFVPSDVATGYGGELTALLQDLDPDRREAFVATQVIGFSYEEAAAMLGCPIGTIRSRVARARRDLAGMVDQADAR